MAKRPKDKNCIDVRVCIDEFTNIEINKYQLRVKLKEYKTYNKTEAASDYFMELVKKDVESSSK